MSRKFVVIGMNWSGAVVAETLGSLGHDVLGIDCDEDRVEELSGQLRDVRLVVADAQRRSTLRSLGVHDFDGAAVTVERDIQASIIATVTLKNLGIPLVVARAINPVHAQILDQVGADRVVKPEEDAGANMARLMVSPSVRRYLDLGGGEALAEVEVPQGWAGKSLSEIRLPEKQNLTVLLRRREGNGTVVDESTTLRKGDSVVVWGKNKDLNRSDLLHGSG